MKSGGLQEKMFALCAEWESSDLNRADFCRKHQINLGRFGYWRSRYLKHQKQSSGDFLELAPVLPGGLEIMYPNGVVLKAPANTSYPELKALITLF